MHLYEQVLGFVEGLGSGLSFFCYCFFPLSFFNKLSFMNLSVGIVGDVVIIHKTISNSWIFKVLSW